MSKFRVPWCPNYGCGTSNGSTFSVLLKCPYCPIKYYLLQKYCPSCKRCRKCGRILKKFYPIVAVPVESILDPASLPYLPKVLRDVLINPSK